MLLVGVMLPGFRVKQGRNLLLHGRGPSAADVAPGGEQPATRGSLWSLLPPIVMPGPGHGQEISTEGSFCCPFCPERSQ